MFQFFENIINFIDILVTFTVNSFNSIIDLFDRAAKGLAFTTVVFTYMPSFVAPVLLSLVSIAVIKLILSLGQR